MSRLMIFGKNVPIVEQESKRDSVQLENNRILISSYKRSVDSLLRSFLADLLYFQLLSIYDQIKREGKVEVFGDLDFEIVEKIDNKKQRVAKLKGNKILVKLNAVALPKSVLRYVVAHEIAHTFTKRHTKKFWKTVELMCPDFEETRRLLTKCAHCITDESMLRVSLHKALDRAGKNDL